MGRMREKAGSDLVRRQNLQLVLATLRGGRPLARTELGRLTGLSPATITAIAGQLIDLGLVSAVDDGPVAASGEQRRGRPLARLDIEPTAGNVLAANIAIDAVELAISDYRGDIVVRETIHLATFKMASERFGRRLAAEARRFLDRAGIAPGRLRRIGVAVQGIADTAAGTIAWSPAFEARGVPVSDPLEREFGVPCAIANDAVMIAEALLRAEPARYLSTALVVFIGYGVGMGLIIDGVVHGGQSGAAAEFGHMNHVPYGRECRCGRRGCIEAYAADYGIIGAARGTAAPHSAVPEATIAEVEASARSGDGAERRAFVDAGLALGFGLSRVIALLKPRRIVFAGPGTRAFPLLEPHIHRGIADGLVADLCPPIEIEALPADRDIIIDGIVSGALRALDRDMLARPPVAVAMFGAAE